MNTNSRKVTRDRKDNGDVEQYYIQPYFYTYITNWENDRII